VTIAWEAAGATDVGRLRRGNEDNFHLDAEHGVFLVADGMGGHAAGEVASELATQTMAELLTPAVASEEPVIPAALRTAVLMAHNRIKSCCEDDPRTRGMGTTLTCCVLSHDGQLHIAHIGDSRLYRLRGGQLEQITHDHTWVQQEVDAGRLPAEDASDHPLSHILTRVLSDDVTPAVDVFASEAQPGDLLLLCTDGLYNMVPHEGLTTILLESSPLADRVRTLITAANQAGGTDNITALLIDIHSG
jgi:PPM family protein phosphatase